MVAGLLLKTGDIRMRYLKHEGKNYILASHVAEMIERAMECAEQRFIKKTIDASRKRISQRSLTGSQTGSSLTAS